MISAFPRVSCYEECKDENPPSLNGTPVSDTTETSSTEFKVDSVYVGTVHWETFDPSKFRPQADNKFFIV